MSTRRGFLKLLGLAAPAAAMGLAVLPTEEVGYRMYHKATILDKEWMKPPIKGIDYEAVTKAIDEYNGWVESPLYPKR